MGHAVKEIATVLAVMLRCVTNDFAGRFRETLRKETPRRHGECSRYLQRDKRKKKAKSFLICNLYNVIFLCS